MFQGEPLARHVVLLCYYVYYVHYVPGRTLIPSCCFCYVTMFYYVPGRTLSPSCCITMSTMFYYVPGRTLSPSCCIIMLLCLLCLLCSRTDPNPVMLFLLCNYVLLCSRANPKPVMLFYYGGGLQFGTAEMYPGQELANTADVVFVNVNYRVSSMGFFSTGSPPLVEILSSTYRVYPIRSTAPNRSTPPFVNSYMYATRDKIIETALLYNKYFVYIFFNKSYNNENL